MVNISVSVKKRHDVKKGLQDGVEAGISAYLSILQAQSKSLSPVDTGLLRSSILKEAGKLMGKIFTKTRYAIYQEEGTNRMSAKPEDGVVNKWGQTHDIKNLFISDGSQFTTGAAENPTLTIVALAIRQAAHIAREMSSKNL